ncbi:MAG: sulfatase-like hydrolase/transferase [Prevotella sp.]|nr:sulfatase-like hydrolase/transferase [Prevotella sp.]
MKRCNVLFWLTVATLIVPNIVLDVTEGMSLMACLTNIVLPMGVYMLLLTSLKRMGKMVWALFPVIFFSAFQLVLIYLYGEGLLSVDMLLNAVTTNFGEATELLDGIAPSVAIVCILYLPILAWASIDLWKRRDILEHKARFRRTGMAVTMAGCMLLGATYFLDCQYDILDHLFPVNVFNNLRIAIQRSYISANYQESVKGFCHHARPSHPKDSAEVYIMVIGETARSDNFQLYGYRRETNPRLSRLKGLTVFKDAMTQSNTTHKSVPMLLTSATANDYDVLYREKGIIAAFREAGFHTTFLSNQLPNHSFIDFLGEEADECLFVKKIASPGSNISDYDLLSHVKTVLAKKRKKEFIALHTYGSHFSYKDRYPRSMAHFTPDQASEAKYANRRELVNAYDNTIRFTDSFLDSLTTILIHQRVQSAWIYTSDHGENLYDDSQRRFLHSSPNPSLYELRIPFMVWTSQEYAASWPSVVKALAANSRKPVENSVSTYHTMLHLAGVTTDNFNPAASLASKSFTPAMRVYINDHNIAKELQWD